MRLTPDACDLKFLKILQALKKIFRAQTNFFLKCLEKNSVQKFFLENFENFLSPSKDDLQKIIFAKKNFAQNFFHSISRRIFFLALHKISNTCKKNSKTLSRAYQGLNAFFSVFRFRILDRYP